MEVQETQTYNQLPITHIPEALVPTPEALVHTPAPENRVQYVVVNPGVQDPQGQVLLFPTPSPTLSSITQEPLQPDPQGQVLSVWTDPLLVPLLPAVEPVLTNPMFFPVWSQPGPSADQNTQAQALFPSWTTSSTSESDSESSEEGAIPPVIYMLPVSVEMPNADLSQQGQGAPEDPEGLLLPTVPTDSPTFAHLGAAAPNTTLTPALTGVTGPGTNAPDLPAGVQQEARGKSGVKEAHSPCAPESAIVGTQKETAGRTESLTLTHIASRGDGA
ncbi:uncharacterized protein LOC121690185 [Alosa sapidissima]|uniref:uncharacterized protein LOC121690185 n=1 Tax=Alosa sapidissima TaxID=34773 RepID=UPI001C087E51|nr:uncharacterized protein LOC121690185 [Alosa sapidissima]